MVTSSDVVTFARHAVGAPPFYMLAFGGVARMPAQLPSSSTGTVACPELGRALSREGLALRHEGHLPFAEPAFCASRTQLRVDGLHRSFEIRPCRRLCSFLRRGTTCRALSTKLLESNYRFRSEYFESASSRARAKLFGGVPRRGFVQRPGIARSHLGQRKSFRRFFSTLCQER
jgi:hypothetical protein